MNLDTFIALIICAFTIGLLVYLIFFRWNKEQGFPKYNYPPPPPILLNDTANVTLYRYINMTQEQKDKFLKFITADLQNMALEYRNNWAAFALYLENENSKGITEFRVVVGDEGKSYIHPLGKDGKTHDFEI